MVAKILAVISLFIISTINRMGYAGIVVLMAIESACIPLPSEVIMPFSGYLVSIGVFKLWLVALMGAIGCVCGSLVAYFIGAWGGRVWVERFGKYILISHHDLDMADRWFDRHGDITVFVARLLPVIRTFIAFPAGVSRMEMGRFLIYTFSGSYIWCFVLAWIGKRLGENWQFIRTYFHKFDILIGIACVALLLWYVRRHLNLIRKPLQK